MATWRLGAGGAPQTPFSWVNMGPRAGTNQQQYLAPSSQHTNEQGQDLYNPFRMEAARGKGRKNYEKMESGWRGGQEHLYDAYGPGAMMDAIRRFYGGQQQFGDPILQAYEKAIGGYGNAGNQYGFGTDTALTNYGQGMDKAIQGYGSRYGSALNDFGAGYGGAIGQYGQALSGYQKGAESGIDAYGGAARQAANAAYGAGVQGLNQAQSSINQRMGSAMGRSGLGQTGVGMAQGALGQSAMASQMPGLQAGYAGQIGQIAQNQQGMQGEMLARLLAGRGTMMGAQGDMYSQLLGGRADRAGGMMQGYQGMQNTLLGGRMGQADTRLGHAGQMLGAAGDLAGRRMGLLDNANQQAGQNLAGRMAMTPEIWNILHQPEMRDRMAKIGPWGNALMGMVGAGTGMIGNRLMG